MVTKKKKKTIKEHIFVKQILGGTPCMAYRTVAVLPPLNNCHVLIIWLLKGEKSNKGCLQNWILPYNCSAKSANTQINLFWFSRLKQKTNYSNFIREKGFSSTQKLRHTIAGVGRIEKFSLFIWLHLLFLVMSVYVFILSDWAAPFFPW